MTELKIPASVRLEADLARCSFCNTPLDPESERTYRRVTGWEHPRTAGGTNALALRQPLDDFACSPCIDRARRGLSPEQKCLL